MGFLRKGLFVATGGASGLAFKANSKKERTAKALEAQNRPPKASVPTLKERRLATQAKRQRQGKS
jgi:hypothetical protein